MFVFQLSDTKLLLDTFPTRPAPLTCLHSIFYMECGSNTFPFVALQVVQLYALQKGYLDNESPDTVQEAVTKVVRAIRQGYPDALERIRRTQCLGPMAEAVLKAALIDVCNLQPQSAVSSL